MPRLVDLSLKFSALHGIELPRFVSYPPHHDTSCLSSVAPHLTSLSLSNVFPEDQIFDQLPYSLTRLHVLALRDRLSSLEDPIYPWFAYSPLSSHRTLSILDKLSCLPRLLELYLTIVGSPSPALVTAIAAACPGLRVLKLEEERYKNIEDDASSQLVQPLQL